MSNLTQKEQCTRGCMFGGAGFGLAVLVLLWLIIGYGFLMSAVFAVMLGAVAIVVLSYLFCNKPDAVVSTPPAAAPADTGVSATPVEDATPAAAPKSDAAPVAAPSKAPAKVAFSGIKPSKELKGEKELAERKGVYKYEAPKSTAPQSATAKPVDQAAVPAAFATLPDDDDGDVAESQPEILTAARTGGADNLKLISGVGPKLEETLNELGFYHFDQIAKWGPAEIAWVDARVRFKGRIVRDNWMDQARILAEGGETEFSSRNKK
ncbi:endonuclease [Sulfitobacter sp.]|uniref:endonuclease n=1 Tax=Sulfitobacter sp. TaxID=1903071 RepID=UPI0035665CAA